MSTCGCTPLAAHRFPTATYSSKAVCRCPNLGIPLAPRGLGPSSIFRPPALRTLERHTPARLTPCVLTPVVCTGCHGPGRASRTKPDVTHSGRPDTSPRTRSVTDSPETGRSRGRLQLRCRRLSDYVDDIQRTVAGSLPTNPPIPLTVAMNPSSTHLPLH